MRSKRSSTRQPTNAARSDRAVSYNEFKEYEGQKYTGMKIGRSHKWYYDKGDWKETKITPDLWQRRGRVWLHFPGAAYPVPGVRPDTRRLARQ